MDRGEHDLTDAQWAALLQAWGGCAYCRASDRRLQRDCVLAVSRGGRYTLTNVVPACDSCNASKCNLEVSTWIRRKRLDERAFLERYAAITAALAEPETQESPLRHPTKGRFLRDGELGHLPVQLPGDTNPDS